MLAAGSIYLLPYIRQSYHKPLLALLGVTNTQLGLMNSVFGVTAMLCYLPGGWFADRYSIRHLLLFSLICTGLSGLWFALFPGYHTGLFVHFIWGVATTLTFWAALIKAARMWGGDQREGRTFGLLEFGSGITEATCALIGVCVFALFQREGLVGIRAVLMVYSMMPLAAALFVYCFVPAPSRRSDASRLSAFDHGASRNLISRFKEMALVKAIWLCTAIIFAAYFAYWGSLDFALFASDEFGASDIFSGTLGAFRLWCRPVAAIAAGLIADRLSVPRTVLGALAVLVVAFGAVSFMPSSDLKFWMLAGDTVLAAVAVFSLRAIYFALLGTARVPLHLTGSAVGFISFFAYSPDVLNPLLTGFLFDTLPAPLAHRIYFFILAAICLLGLLTTVMLIRVAERTPIASAIDPQKADSSV